MINVSLKKLIGIARKWQKMAGIHHDYNNNNNKAISLTRSRLVSSNAMQQLVVPNKGHFVVYSIDNERFVVPLAYLKSFIFRELFKMSEEEFGLPSNRPITLPCDSAFMAYVVSILDWKVSQELEKALLLSLASPAPGNNRCFQGLINCTQIRTHGI